MQQQQGQYQNQQQQFHEEIRSEPAQPQYQPVIVFILYFIFEHY